MNLGNNVFDYNKIYSHKHNYKYYCLQYKYIQKENPMRMPNRNYYKVIVAMNEI